MVEKYTMLLPHCFRQELSSIVKVLTSTISTSLPFYPNSLPTFTLAIALLSIGMQDFQEDILSGRAMTLMKMLAILVV